MAGQKGNDIGVAIAAAAPSRTMLPVQGLLSRDLTLTARPFETAATARTKGWRQALDGVSAKGVQLRGRGLYKGAPSDLRLLESFLSAAPVVWQFTLPDLGLLSGLMQIVSLSWNGVEDRAVGFNFEAQSAGVMTFTPEARDGADNADNADNSHSEEEA